MKTFTVTLHHSNNYGALLQAYALQRVQQSMGIDNTIFEYPYSEGFYDKPDLRNLKGVPKTVYHNLIKWVHKSQITRREESFRRFHRERMKLSRIYTSMDDLRSDDIDADVLIAGSDQVWRFTGNREFIPARFLDFGAPGVRKISYAASIESLSYTEEQKKTVKEWLSDYDAISVREGSAREYLGGVIGREVERVLDPVFLLTAEQWSEIAVKPDIDEPYILCYQVQRCPGMQETVDHLKKLTGLRTVSVMPGSMKYIDTDESRYDVTPEEFLGLYSAASVVVSSSFHGTAFGLLFEKPVYAVLRPSGSARLRDITSLLGVQNFCVDAHSQIPVPEAFDADGLGERIRIERERSMAFLQKQLIG